MGDLLGVLSEDQVLAFFTELGHEIVKSGMTFEAWCEKNPSRFEEMAYPYTK